jgi:type IV pilus assembly protein PilO
MALIPDDPTQKQALAAIAFALALLYFANSLWYSGAVEDVEAQEARVENMQAQNRTAQALAIRAGQDTEERMALYERHIAQLEQLIPESAEVLALLDQISGVERDVGVIVDMMRPEAVEPGPFYDKQTFQMRVFGEFHDIGRFLTNIASLSRILTPIDVSLETFTDPRAGSFDAPVVVNFRFQTYVVPERLPGAVPADGGNP